MRYVLARYKERQRDTTYRIFVTQSLQLIPQNKYLNVGYSEMINQKPQDNRTGDEVAIEVIKNIGLKFK